MTENCKCIKKFRRKSQISNYNKKCEKVDSIYGTYWSIWLKVHTGEHLLLEYSYIESQNMSLSLDPATRSQTDRHDRIRTESCSTVVKPAAWFNHCKNNRTTGVQTVLYLDATDKCRGNCHWFQLLNLSPRFLPIDMRLGDQNVLSLRTETAF
jgi:hypothetical protein